MMSNTSIVDEYLQSLEGMQQAETKPFFYTRLKSRMDEKKQTQQIFNLRPVYVICTLLALLVVNFWMINIQQEYKKQKEAAATSLEGFAEVYNFTTPNY
jgi:hypothetical protein